MSVSDPLIKDIKGCVQKFLKEENNESITDNNANFILLGESLEKVFNKGLITHQTTLYFTRTIDAYAWMYSLVKAKSDIVTFTYKNCVENVKQCCDTTNNTARFRLLVKYCLMKRCLHVPVEFLVRTKRSHLFYSTNSIINDEILSEIFLSVLLQIGKVNFNLDLSNSSFLDCSWFVPNLVRMELVPCKFLGLSVSFVHDRAVIVHVAPNSVIAENGEIKMGDVLDKLNGIHVTSTLKGRLNATLCRKKGEPVNIVVVKAYNKEAKQFFLPIKSLLMKVNIDCSTVVKQYENDCAEAIFRNNICSGYNVKYLGIVDVGSVGNVKMVQRAVAHVSRFQSVDSVRVPADDFPITRVNKVVTFEFGEIGIKVKDAQTNEILLDHSYMQISSCGSSQNYVKNFGYCASSKNCDVATHFNCYVFSANLTEDADNILLAIGQGFGRTHFAV